MFNGIYDYHKKKIIWCFFLILFSLILMFYFLINCYSVSQKDFERFINLFIPNIITFVSICFGFYLTSLSILFSSKFIKELNIEDNKKPTQRYIHTLREYFKLAIYCSLTTIALSFLVLFVTSLQKIYITTILFSILTSVFIENFIFIVLLLKIFLNALVFQARPAKD